MDGFKRGLSWWSTERTAAAGVVGCSGVCVVEPRRRPGCAVPALLWPFGSGLGGSPEPCPRVRAAASEAAE